MARMKSDIPAPLRWFALAAVVVFATSAFAIRVRQKNGSTPSPLDSRQISFTDIDSGGLRIGDPAAPVRIIEFFDFECVHCRRMYDMLEAERRGALRNVAVIYRHFPLSGIGHALPAAVAAECAAAQGRFDAYANMLFRAQDTIARVLTDSAARLAGVPDILRFHACRANSETRLRVASDIKAGEKLGVVATPTFIIGDQLYVGELTRDRLVAAIDHARTRRTESSPKN